MPVRATSTEAALTDQPAAADTVKGAALAGASELDTVSDVHATGSYRRRVAAHLMQTALDAAIEEARSVGA